MKSSSRSAVDPFIVMDVMEAARAAEAAGRHIIHMEVGQPGTPAPNAARQKLAEGMETGALGYTVALGLPELRARIARLYKDWYGVDLDPARVVVTAGASGAFILAFTALFDAGDRVALGVPGYPSYRQILSAMSVTPVPIETTFDARFQPVPSQIPDDVQGMIVASPANPTGTMLSVQDLTALIEGARAKGAAFISDEIYHNIGYDTRAATALEISDEVIVINSFSKYFSMTGWRVGWMVVPDHLVRTVERLAQNMFICPSHASQLTALAAIDCTDELDANIAIYARNRALLLDGLPKAGFDKIAPPDGAFYFYADVSDLTDDSRAFAADILEKVGVAITPGLDFDPLRGHQTIRLSYAGTTEDMKEGLARLARYMAERA